MRPPAWPVRRLIFAPALVVGVVLALGSLPVVLIVAAFVSRYVPGRWRILRIIWFLFLYLIIEVLGLVALFVLWLGSGFGWKLHTPLFQEAHYWLMAKLLRRVVASAKFTFRVSIVQDGPSPRTGGEQQRRPILVFSRHAGPGDSILLMDGLANDFRRRPRIVLKEFLAWDPMIDCILNRVPSAFVPVGGGARVLEAIREIAGTMATDDAFVIFPEGANYTERRYIRAIERLTEIGRPDLVERARALTNTLPPRSKGVMTALGAAPGADVFFVGHAGLETFITPGDIWRGMPMDTKVAVRIWHCRAEDIPPPEAQEGWLYDMWADIDRWISSRLADTGEYFDDPDAY